MSAYFGEVTFNFRNILMRRNCSSISTGFYFTSNFAFLIMMWPSLIELSVTWESFVIQASILCKKTLLATGTITKKRKVKNIDQKKRKKSAIN